MEGAWSGNYRRSAAAHQPVAVQLSRARYGNRNRLTDDILGLGQADSIKRQSPGCLHLAALPLTEVTQVNTRLTSCIIQLLARRLFAR
jgi:hypothetical protein